MPSRFPPITVIALDRIGFSLVISSGKERRPENWLTKGRNEVSKTQTPPFPQFSNSKITQLSFPSFCQDEMGKVGHRILNRIVISLKLGLRESALVSKTLYIPGDLVNRYPDQTSLEIAYVALCVVEKWYYSYMQRFLLAA